MAARARPAVGYGFLRLEMYPDLQLLASIVAIGPTK